MEDLNYLAVLTDWYDTNQGKQLYHYEAEQLAQFLPNCFGYQLLQIGGPVNLHWLETSPIKHKILLNIDKHAIPSASSFCGDPAYLPFAHESIDVIFLPHVLESLDNPATIIKEICNVLTPGGIVIILGLNRMSLWGMQHYLHVLRTKNTYFPWFQRFVPLKQLQHLFFENNCIVDTVHIGCYQPLNMNTTTLIKNTSFWDAIGAIAWPTFGAIYVMLARKQVYGMTPIWDKNMRSALYEIKIGLGSVEISR